VSDAIRFSLEHLKTRQKSIPLTEAVENLISTKKAAGRSLSYCRLLTGNLKKLTSFYPNRTVGELTKRDIDAFLASLATHLAPQTVNTVRRDCVSLWSFCVASEYADRNVAELSELASEIPKTPAVLTPTQAADLLNASHEADMTAFIAIALFAGLRVHEIKKLDWKHIDLEDGSIQVSAEMDTKRKSRRSVPIQPNLRLWLEPIAHSSGKVVNQNHRRRWLATRKRAKLTSWDDNCMRHSFVSYRLAAKPDRAAVASEARHSQAVLESNYLNLVRNSDANKYWEIVPQTVSLNISDEVKKP